jgi:hypothetical protein
VLSFALQANAINHRGYIGQDFAYHRYNVILAIGGWQTVLSVLPLTDPPLYYFTAAWIYQVSGASLVAVALFTSAVNAIAIGFLLVLLRGHLSRLMLLSLAIILAFVPFRLIWSAVIASDSLTVPVFVGIVALLILHCSTKSSTERTYSVILLSGALAVGVVEKYSFVGLMPVAVWMILRSAFLRKASLLRWGAIAAVCLVPAIALCGALYMLDKSEQGAFTGRQWRNPDTPPDMSLEDVLLPKTADLTLLNAPAYDEGAHVPDPSCIREVGIPPASYNLWEDPAKMEILVNHQYSYLGLLHLSAFTDVLNIFQADPCAGYFGERTDANRARMSLAAKLSIPLAILTIAGVLVAVVGLLRHYLGRGRFDITTEVLLLCSLATFGEIALGMTGVQNAYSAGYWLARLVMAPLIGFIAIGFIMLDRWIGNARTAYQLAILGGSVVLASTYVSFLVP